MPAHARTNEDCRRALNSSDPNVFASLFADYNPRLLTYCSRYATNRIDVDDLAQETWLCVWKHHCDYRGSGSFAGWLLHIGRSVCNSSLGQCYRGESRLDGADLAAVQSIDPDDLEAEQTLDDSRLSLILGLPQRQRRVVLLRLCAGRSTQQTAVDLGCAVGTVKATLHQAISSLRRADSLASANRSV